MFSLNIFLEYIIIFLKKIVLGIYIFVNEEWGINNIININLLYVGIYIGIYKIICINYFVRLILFSLSKIWIDKVMLKINRDVLILFFGMYLRINKICMMIWIIDSFF